MTLLLTTSWDDGHPLDRRLADLLARHGIGATFYCPLHNREGPPVMTGADLRELAGAGFEIGSHTYDHVYADQVPPSTWAEQVRRGKAELEAALGQAVAGFCYPGGVFGARQRETVMAQGFAYARTTVNLHAGVGDDLFALPTTLQLYPHSRSVLWRNFLRHGRWRSRWPLLRASAAPTLEARVLALLVPVQRHGGVLHLWGHSWEIEALDLWPQLDRLFALLAAHVPAADRLNNRALLQRLGRLP